MPYNRYPRGRRATGRESTSAVITARRISAAVSFGWLLTCEAASSKTGRVSGDCSRSVARSRGGRSSWGSEPPTQPSA